MYLSINTIIAQIEERSFQISKGSLLPSTSAYMYISFSRANLFFDFPISASRTFQIHMIRSKMLPPCTFNTLMVILAVNSWVAYGLESGDVPKEIEPGKTYTITYGPKDDTARLAS